MTVRIRLKIQVAEMRFLYRVAGLTLHDKARSSGIQENLSIELLFLYIEGNQLRLSELLVRTLPDCFLLGSFFSEMVIWEETLCQTYIMN